MLGLFALGTAGGLAVAPATAVAMASIPPERSGMAFAQRMAQREAELATRTSDGPWGRLMEEVLTRPMDLPATKAEPPALPELPRLRVTSDTRWE